MLQSGQAGGQVGDQGIGGAMSGAIGSAIGVTMEDLIVRQKEIIEQMSKLIILVPTPECYKQVLKT